jgi:hypothetical protein
MKVVQPSTDKPTIYVLSLYSSSVDVADDLGNPHENLIIVLMEALYKGSGLGRAFQVRCNACIASFLGIPFVPQARQIGKIFTKKPPAL